MVRNQLTTIVIMSNLVLTDDLVLYMYSMTWFNDAPADDLVLSRQWSISSLLAARSCYGHYNQNHNTTQHVSYDVALQSTCEKDWAVGKASDFCSWWVCLRAVTILYYKVLHVHLKTGQKPTTLLTVFMNMSWEINDPYPLFFFLGGGGGGVI